MKTIGPDRRHELGIDRSLLPPAQSGGGGAAPAMGLHSAPLIVHSVDFAPMAAMQASGDWAGAGRQLANIARGLQTAGAEVIGLASNTMHIVAEAITAAIGVPFIHIADPTSAALKTDGFATVGLLGTRFTMEMADDRLHDRAGTSACCRGTAAKRGADAQGRSRGGLSTKIHAAGDALGLPIRLIGTPGQRNDIAFAHDLIDGFEADATIADKGYDADHLHDRIAEAGARIVIPPSRNRKVHRQYDAEPYADV